MATDAGNLFGPLLTVSIVLPGSNPTATDTGCYNSALVSDVTIPSGTRLDPGKVFEKTWEIKNTGTCDWTRDFKITFVGGDLFGSDTTKIRKRVTVRIDNANFIDDGCTKQFRQRNQFMADGKR